MAPGFLATGAPRHERAAPTDLGLPGKVSLGGKFLPEVGPSGGSCVEGGRMWPPPSGCDLCRATR